MPDNDLMIRKGFVVCGALVYWTGVLIHAYRIRRHIGKSPNVRPRGLKERILWLGWLSVIIGWILQPLIINKQEGTFLFSFIDILYHPLGIIWGAVLPLCGYAGTLWCYAALGENWRMGIDRNERTALITHGPYRYVRHPIYLFQILILSGMTLLLPTPFSFLILLIHMVCVIIKALDEEEYLNSMHGTEYRSYLSHTGMLFPSINALFHSLRKRIRMKEINKNQCTGSDRSVIFIIEGVLLIILLLSLWKDLVSCVRKGDIKASVTRGEKSMKLLFNIMTAIVMFIYTFAIQFADAFKGNKVLIFILNSIALIYLFFLSSWFRNSIFFPLIARILTD